MTVDNVSAGFRKMGVFPFYPEAILKDFVESNSSTDESKIELTSRSSSPAQSHFSPEQLAKFEERYENKN